MTYSYADAFKSYQTTATKLAELSHANFEALNAVTRIVADGANLAGQALVDYSRGAFEQGVSTGKALLTVKSLPDAVEIHSSYLKGSADAAYAETIRLSKLGAQVASEAAAPITGRINATIEAFKQPLAA